MYTKPMGMDHTLAVDLGGAVTPNALVEPDLFGIEVELEGRHIITELKEIRAFWDVHKDGSLRIKSPGDEAIEYVFRYPLTFDMACEASKALFKFLNSPGVKVYESYRTSIHVHINCAMESLRTIYNLITLSIIFDELFVSQNGDHRIGNNFCLRAKDAQGQIHELVNSISNQGSPYNMSHANRYSSVNFVSLMKFGTIEYRSLECTTDFDRLKHWIETLAKLKVAAREFENPQEIVKYFSRMPTHEFLYYVLGPCASKYARVSGVSEMLHEGMRLAQDFAFCSKWIARPHLSGKSVKVDAVKKVKFDWNDPVVGLQWPNIGPGAAVAAGAPLVVNQIPPPNWWQQAVQHPQPDWEEG